VEADLGEEHGEELQSQELDVRISRTRRSLDPMLEQHAEHLAAELSVG
jgi:hypothetical protein